MWVKVAFIPRHPIMIVPSITLLVEKYILGQAYNRWGGSLRVGVNEGFALCISFIPWMRSRADNDSDDDHFFSSACSSQYSCYINWQRMDKGDKKRAWYQDSVGETHWVSVTDRKRHIQGEYIGNDALKQKNQSFIYWGQHAASPSNHTTIPIFSPAIYTAAAVVTRSSAGRRVWSA